MSSRREVLKTLAAGSAAAFVPVAAPAAGRPGWDAEADVLIVGSGVAGTAAAMAATENGATVILLEKMPFQGGTTQKSGGVFWIPDNPWLRAQGTQDERGDALRYMARLAYPERYAGQNPTLGLDPHAFDLLAHFYDHGHRVVAALMKSTALKPMPWTTWDGRPYPDYFADIAENKVPRGRSQVPDMSGSPELVVWPANGGAGAGLMQQLTAGFAGRPIDVRLEHRVLDTLRDDRGAVTGLLVDRGDDTPARFGARRGVIFCSGGFTHNPDLARSFLKGHIWGGCAAPGSTGDFIAIAQRAGARLGNMGNAWWGQIPVELALKTRSVPADVWQTPGDSMIQVNRYGRRFVNEKIQYNERTQAHFAWDPVRAEYPNLIGFMIWDARTAQRYAGYDPIPAANAQIEHVLRADTLEALEQALAARLEKIAQHTGGLKLDAAFLPNLRASIARFNVFAENGRDEDFERGSASIETAFQFMIAEKAPNPHPNLTMHPIADQGPYHAILLGAGTLDTKGGPVANARGEVLDAGSGEPIPGLYAAGNCAASAAGQAYWAGGGTIGPAMTFGYLAGEAAARRDPTRVA